jgi:hypothetical protein
LVLPVGREGMETEFAAGPNAVLMFLPLRSLLAHANALNVQMPPAKSSSALEPVFPRTMID